MVLEGVARALNVRVEVVQFDKTPGPLPIYWYGRDTTTSRSKVLAVSPAAGSDVMEKSFCAGEGLIWRWTMECGVSVDNTPLM